MQAVLISINPKWCEPIASGKKTVEVRKNKPNLETPFKVFIYETKNSDTIFAGNPRKPIHLSFGMGKIIGEFVCDKIENIEIRHFTVFGHENLYTAVGENPDNQWLKHSCLSYDEVARYGRLAPLYGWHISDLVIYDEPRELKEFLGRCNRAYCTGCEDFCDEGETSFRVCGGLKAMTRPPRSWCYVEGE